jgi:hypothetical protein
VDPDFEQEIVDQYALAMAAAGLSDGHIRRIRAIVIEFAWTLTVPLWAATLPPEVIRTLPFGTALVLLRSAPPIVTDLRPWTARRDARVVAASRTEVEAALRRR